MNIFYLDHNPKSCAEMHIDTHSTKMLVEYAQIMSTAHRVLDGKLVIRLNKANRTMKTYDHPTFYDHYLYKSCHVNHPSNIWVRQSKENYEWLYEMWLCLHKEYQIRYGDHKYHKSVAKLKNILKHIPENIPDVPFTQPLQAMPDDVKHEDSVTAYRNYYIKYKKSLATWKTKTPEWFIDHS
jgi:hypothetical protein